jgi:hypothetical protein
MLRWIPYQLRASAMSSLFREAIPVTPAWKMALVRIFGKRHIQFVEGGTLEYYVWRGKTYIESFSE